MIDPGLKDRTVMITGANHGIGAAAARKFAEQGARVFVAFFREPSPYDGSELAEARAANVGGDLLYRAMQQQNGDLVTAGIRRAGGVGFAHEADLSDATMIPALFDRCESELGAVEVLVNNHTYCVHETFA